jgi:hypothetical protein
LQIHCFYYNYRSWSVRFLEMCACFTWAFLHFSDSQSFASCILPAIMWKNHSHNTLKTMLSFLFFQQVYLYNSIHFGTILIKVLTFEASCPAQLTLKSCHWDMSYWLRNIVKSENQRMTIKFCIILQKVLYIFSIRTWNTLPLCT